jgi:arginine/lysine/ornithine decarboxylase
LDLNRQKKAPVYEALERFRKQRVVPFDVPGHKRGRGNSELVRFLGDRCVGIDVNSMKPLDNLCHPVSVIKEAEELMADAFGAAHAFMMVNGTTSAVQAMVLSQVKMGEKIIMPRNVHKSAINALFKKGIRRRRKGYASQMLVIVLLGRHDIVWTFGKGCRTQKVVIINVITLVCSCQR